MNNTIETVVVYLKRLGMYSSCSKDDITLDQARIKTKWVDQAHFLIFPYCLIALIKRQTARYTDWIKLQNSQEIK